VVRAPPTAGVRAGLLARHTRTASGSVRQTIKSPRKSGRSSLVQIQNSILGLLGPPWKVLCLRYMTISSRVRYRVGFRRAAWLFLLRRAFRVLRTASAPVAGRRARRRGDQLSCCSAPVRLGIVPRGRGSRCRGLGEGRPGRGHVRHPPEAIRGRVRRCW